MHITVVGAGALGSVYGCKLARAADVSFVVRDLSRAPRRIHIERLNGPLADTLEAPSVTTEIPEATDAIVCAVRVDQVDAALVDKLARATATVVMLPPLLPPHLKPLRDRLGERLVPAMVGVIAYEPSETPGERRVRYWTPGSSPTLLEDHPRARPFVELLRRVGIPADVSARTASLQAATTIAFFPILLGIAAAGGSIDRMINDKSIMDLGFRATKETRAIAKTVGELPAWANLFFKFSTPLTARAGIKLGQARAPEAFVFLEKHFGNKLATQNLALFRDIEALAKERGIAIDALRQLIARAHR